MNRELDRDLAGYLRAAEGALDGSDFRGAIELGDRALGAAREDTPREAIGTIRLIQAEAHRWLGELAQAEPHAVAAVEAVEASSDRWFTAVGELAIIAGTLGHAERLVALGEALLARWSPSPPSELIVASERAALALMQSGLRALGDALYDRLASAEASVREPVARARIQQAMATRALLAGDPAQHLRRAEAAADLFTHAGDLRPAASAHVTVGIAHANFGQHERAERAFREALALGQQFKLPAICAGAKHNLGLVLAQRGALAEALAMEREALATFTEQKSGRLSGGARVYSAMILSQLGRHDEAAAEASAALDDPQSTPPVHALALVTLADVELAQHRPEAALPHARAAFALLGELGGLEAGEAQIRLVHAESLYASGDVAGARQAIAEAEQRLLARAAKIHDPELRTSFLGRVAENARTLAAVAAWGARS